MNPKNGKPSSEHADATAADCRLPIADCQLEKQADGQVDVDVTQSMARAGEAENPRLVSAVREYMAALESGRHISRQELLARNPEIAAELSACLDGLAFVHAATAQMQAPAAGGAPSDGSSDLVDPAIARPLGDFRLVRELGRGGMGVVYEATQLSLGRRVAVKVLSFAAALDPRHLQRFRNEAQAAAQLHHTNIVPVYAVGCERGVHFYAMQLIDGQSLADVVRELGEGAGNATDGSPALARDSDSGRLGPMPSERRRITALDSAQNLSMMRTMRRPAYYRAVARLGLQAAEALDYAHQMGVVHRDIKPANLLLDMRGNLWITDFGLAQFYEEDGLTRTGDLLGTLRYMSPEQASGRAVLLDQRTDIYSLGMTLYELLTLRRALPGHSREQLLHEIGSVDPLPPRAIDKTIPPELETILCKTISKDPSERYQTARALADDLQRFLRDEPILARPPSAWDKAVKWTRRHKSAALSALLMLFVTALGLLVSLLFIAHAEARTHHAYVLEQAKAKEADGSFKQAREAVDFFTQVASDDMADRPELGQLREKLLQRALLYYQSFLEDHKDDPSTGAELATAQWSVSTILNEMATAGRLFRLINRVSLLPDSAVRDTLNLTPQQRQQIDQFINLPAWFGTFASVHQLSAEKRGEQYVQKATEIEKNLNGILTAPQLARLGQIYLQVRADDAFNDPEVATALGLTREQKEQIKSVRDQAFRTILIFHHGGFHGGPHDGHPPPPPPDRAEEHRRKEELLAKILALLTPAQVSRWESMRGEPFAGAANCDLGFGRPGPHPPEEHHP